MAIQIPVTTRSCAASCSRACRPAVCSRRRRSSCPRTGTRPSRTWSSGARRPPRYGSSTRSSRTSASPATSPPRRSARRRRAGRPQAAGLRVFVHAGQPEGDQRLRAAGRTDVRPPRHVRRRRVRGRGRRRDGARTVARAAAARHGQRLEGAEPVAAARSDRRRSSAARSSAEARGSAIAQGSQFGLGTLLLRYSRDFEKQADLLGAQIMARAGYDPRALARMFETIERESKAAAAAPAVDEQPPESRQPHAIHHRRKPRR